MRHITYWVGLLLAGLLAGSGCAAEAPKSVDPNAILGTDLEAVLPAGDAARGQALFMGQVDGKYPCTACHSVAPGQNLVGPSLAGLGAAAAGRREGYTAARFLREAIVLPNANLAAGYYAGIMPQDFGQQMTAQELADLVAYLSSLQ